MAEKKRSVDRPVIAQDNPRHAVWIDDAKGLRRIIAATPGEEQINIGGGVYAHTRELKRDGPWVYTVVAP